MFQVFRRIYGREKRGQTRALSISWAGAGDETVKVKASHGAGKRARFQAFAGVKANREFGSHLNGS